MPVEYKLFNIPLLARNLMASRQPPVQPSVPPEFSDDVSRNISDWSIDNGEPLNSKGQTLPEFADFWLSSRPHCLVPAAVIDVQDETWLSGNLDKQGERWKQLREFLGSDAATNAAIKAEAELYGAKFGSTQKGRKPGTKPEADSADKGGPNNAWSEAYAKRHGQDAAYAERARLMRTLGLKACTSMAAAAGRTITGAVLKK